MLWIDERLLGRLCAVHDLEIPFNNNSNEKNKKKNSIAETNVIFSIFLALSLAKQIDDDCSSMFFEYDIWMIWIFSFFHFEMNKKNCLWQSWHIKREIFQHFKPVISNWKENILKPKIKSISKEQTNIIMDNRWILYTVIYLTKKKTSIIFVTVAMCTFLMQRIFSEENELRKQSFF